MSIGMRIKRRFFCLLQSKAAGTGKKSMGLTYYTSDPSVRRKADGAFFKQIQRKRPPFFTKYPR